LRSIECDCQPDQCKAAPVSAPAITFRFKDFAAVLAFGAFISLIAFAQLYTENKRLEGVDKVNQEIVKW
jgi:hypothetical protein